MLVVASLFCGSLLAVFISYTASSEKDVFEMNLDLLASGEITILDCDHVGAYCVPTNDDVWCLVETTTQTLLCKNMEKREDINL